MAGLDISDTRLEQGGGLEEMGIGAVKRANQGMEAAAYSESEREQYNARVRGGNKSGNQQLGASVGSVVGGVVGTYFGMSQVGVALGGMAGGMVGGAF